jgi:hypothetical protein
MGLLYGRAGRLNTKNAGFRPGQKIDRFLSKLHSHSDQLVVLVRILLPVTAPPR